jgi:hypothetical protein
MKASYGGIKTEYIIAGVVILIIFFMVSGSSDSGSNLDSGGTSGNGGYTGPLPTNMSSGVVSGAQDAADATDPIGAFFDWVGNLFN